MSCSGGERDGTRGGDDQSSDLIPTHSVCARVLSLTPLLVPSLPLLVGVMHAGCGHDPRAAPSQVGGRAVGPLPRSSSGRGSAVKGRGAPTPRHVSCSTRSRRPPPPPLSSSSSLAPSPFPHCPQPRWRAWRTLAVRFIARPGMTTRSARIFSRSSRTTKTWLPS